jgi:eukaryotic-like serine/threonine-protein kinase
MSEIQTGFTAAPFSRTHPDRIGPYRILQVLGEGGMGIVYEAEQTAPMRRRVALKVGRQEIQTKEMLARFDVERQALAVMNHPGIAKVHEAGTTSAGQPYFVMELVNGLPLADYCDVHKLSIPDRLELFVTVCEAVQHAHQKGVIHRDLKPSNVLVADQQGGFEVKIIDFGIAKALGQQLTDKTLVTLHGRAIGTAAYMSPEQAGSGLDVDTRSDIYSLGVMLYELLVGRLPVDPADVGVEVLLTRLALGEISAPPPSARFHALGAARDHIAHARRTDSDRLTRRLRGDLGWIIMKAMDPDRSSRYETAAALAIDLRRHLAFETVSARPHGIAYRSGKFVRRHRAAVTAAAIALVAIIVGAVGSVIGMVRATRAERRAEQEAAAAQQVTSFLVDLFAISDPDEAQGSGITAREVLDRGARRVQRDLAGEPLLQGRIMHTMGSVYRALGLYDPARALLEDALRVRERALTSRDPGLAETLEALGDVAREQGRPEEAERYYRRALAVRTQATDADAADSTGVLTGLAMVRADEGRNLEAESIYVRVLAIQESARNRDEPRLARTLTGLAAVYWAQARYERAEELMRRALAIQERTLGPDHADVAATLNNLGALYWTLGRYADALPLYERTRTIFERTLGAEHRSTASVLSNLGETYWKLHRYREAEALFRQALAVKERVLPRTHPSVAVTLTGLAGLLRDEGRYAEAEPLYRRALAIRERSPGADTSDAAEVRRELSEVLRRMGRVGEADGVRSRTTPR